MAKNEESPPSGKKAGKSRDVAKQETREALIAAGVSAFAEEGLDAPSLDSICARAGFTRGAFYVHFKDRDDFLVAVMEHIFGLFLDAIIATGDAAFDLQRTIEAFALAAESGGFPLRGAVPLHQFLAACARSPDVRDRFVEVLREAVRRVTVATREGQEAGTVRPDVNAEHIATVLTAIALGVQSMIEVVYPLDIRPAALDVARVLRPND
jgi:AcrR family transcriptional regulator